MELAERDDEILTLAKDVKEVRCRVANHEVKLREMEEQREQINSRHAPEGHARDFPPMAENFLASVSSHAPQLVTRDHASIFYVSILPNAFAARRGQQVCHRTCQTRGGKSRNSFHAGRQQGLAARF